MSRKYEPLAFGSTPVRGYGLGEYAPDPRRRFIRCTLPALVYGPPTPRQEPPPPLELTAEEWRVADRAMREWIEGLERCDR